MFQYRKGEQTCDRITLCLKEKTKKIKCIFSVKKKRNLPDVRFLLWAIIDSVKTLWVEPKVTLFKVAFVRN